MKYIKQLDSLRTLAILTVIIVHWFPKDNSAYLVSAYINAPKIFFTISGFLITAILLKAKVKTETTSDKYRTIKNFFFKRALRIFPAYFLVLAIWFFTGPATEKISYKYFLTFTANIYIYKVQIWPALAHLWSISVEEQFYLIWPWLIIFSNRITTLMIIIISILTGIGAQFLNHNQFANILTINNLDGIGIGALLSFLLIKEPDYLLKKRKIIYWIAIICFFLSLIQLWFLPQTHHFGSGTFISIMTAGLLMYFISNGKNENYTFSSLFDNKLLMSMGKISYGLFLYHFLIPYYTYNAFTRIADFLHIPFSPTIRNYLWMLGNFIILLLLAKLSYHYFEMPFLKLKKYFKDGIQENQKILEPVPKNN
ncbi:acyltransferase family protein [Pedobacter nyackensis]|uniref:Peptidoglycan/LPS O-acetylase OafA/YrhL, contains acyltransferase and SGNH-hydrolase domains n=1 Tax=Pedobacter nyackensis TaxID=475255 RepID=A0A1W2EZT3_9SPHI|nr:acyltransferase [Pedobacter nyackensis]SMD15199.1 Peptidoglycan/LPS O-acetylase OafA/YrhL, contains acyltransferase and SGNH-hydrolase domains [Pedobacter nyackensis]